MRLRLVLAFAALATLAACDQADEGKARAPIGAASAPVAAATPAPAAAAAANCPTLAPACPTPHKARAKAPRAHPRPAVRHAVAGKPKPPTAGARQHARADTTTGLPPHPYRYDELNPPPRVDHRAEVDGHRPHEHHGHGWAEGGPPPGHGYAERRNYEDQQTYEHRSPPSQRRYESYAESGGGYVIDEGCRCAPAGGAAGFDSRGYLTWPGKVPPR